MNTTTRLNRSNASTMHSNFRDDGSKTPTASDGKLKSPAKNSQNSKTLCKIPPYNHTKYMLFKTKRNKLIKSIKQYPKNSTVYPSIDPHRLVGFTVCSTIWTTHIETATTVHDSPCWSSSVTKSGQLKVLALKSRFMSLRSMFGLKKQNPKTHRSGHVDSC